MGAKVYADCLSDERVASSPEPELSVDVPTALPEESAEERSEESSHETEVLAVAAWFEALPDEWRSYFDHEAASGQRAYGQA